MIKYKKEPISRWADLVWCIKSLGLVYAINLKLLFCDYWLSILRDRNNEADYWKFVFRISSFVDKQKIYEIVGRKWLNDFYLLLKKQLYELGYEIFGSEFPDFKSYNALSSAEKAKIGINQKLKNKPNRTWYPRFLSCKEKITYLKDLKGVDIGQLIISRIEKEYDTLLRYSDYASNRQKFNKDQEWW